MKSHRGVWQNSTELSVVHRLGTVEMNVVGTTVAPTKETRVVLVVGHHATTREETVRRVVACSVHRDDKTKEEMKEDSSQTHPRIQEHRKDDGGSNMQHVEWTE